MNKNTKNTIMITGAGGFLGGELLNQIIEDTDYFAVAITSQPHKLYDKFGKKRLVCYSFEDINKNAINWKDIDVIVHCAFARSYDAKSLAEAIKITNNLFVTAKEMGVKSIINISSQSAYGQINKAPWKEDFSLSPDSLYAMAKYSTEKLLENVIYNESIWGTNIRLSSLLGVGFDVRLVNKFVIQALKEEPIKIVGGNQKLSFMDIRDAASGILALMKTDCKKWKKVYNLGCEWRHSIIEIAEIVKEIAKEYNKNVKIVIEEKDVYLDSGMDSTLFYKDTGWKPKYNMKDIVKNIFNYLLEDKND